MSKAPVIRVVKKKHVHAGHHGGSWKVAYADFVTAMMAFFLVLWLLSMDQQLKEQIQSYFNDPTSPSNSIAGISKLAAGGKSPVSSGPMGIGARNWRDLAMQAEQQRFNNVQERLQQEIDGCPDLSHLRQHVKVHVTHAGLSVELIEASGGTFFESGSAYLPEPTRKLLVLIARQLGQLNNPIIIEGHTDVVPYQASGEYSNWELSTDRANAARRLMEANGLRPHQVTEVRGYADSRLRDPRRPREASNRRVSILVHYAETDRASTEAVEADEEQSEDGQEPFQLNIRPGSH
jgi:chemotaxis protein MotB